MPTAKVNSVKAADPGLGFTLNFDPPLGNTLKVVITMTDLNQPEIGSYQSEVTLHNSISDKELVFVVPFGDNAYAPSNQFSFKIELYSPHDNESSLTSPLTGVVMGENGSFSFSTSVPTTITGFPQTGNMLQSEDGAFIGIYQKDGNFCVYPQFADHQSNLNPVYSTNTAIGSPTYFGIYPVDKKNIKIVIQDLSGKYISWSNMNFPSVGAYNFSISSNGTLCISDLPVVFSSYNN